MKSLKLRSFFIYTFIIFISLSSCVSDAEFDASGEGKGGSMTRFTFLKGYLYIVDENTLKTFDIANPDNPELLNTLEVGSGVETIFPYENYLFLGTQWGMKIYSLDNGPVPQFLSDFEHSFSCDPVVVSNSIAYVTLRSGTTCQTGVDRMEVVDVSNLRDPRLLNTIEMKNPHGLSVSDTVLFVCEGDYGFKVFNIKDRANPQLISHYDSIPSYDVITNYARKELIITGKNGIYQYDYNDPYELKELSQILSIEGNE
ncbi:LVIVD repeat-containing protein [Marivirga arenosa]|uniref:LVIVD repeat-containing protein n=1 Tax=Marivirga arenosa TaxID=3059076 RepID=A0AA49GCP4_9BACT|nr:hypothetical protein [Marivirga sp. BKB1-2]WKK81685.2 hypothetical protein QYS47_05340 [Marivirga sp. BKB1-2]